MTANERVSRSVALEQTYVHDVYEQYYDNHRSKPWPIIKEFLSGLEPGALVCDVGCGNGKYLKENTSIYNIGGEKSIRLSELARQQQNEIIKLDNLALPFRDNCLDAVLSISVVHHLATTERRVCALRELARVLRVGGRLVITVWAMEQAHRKFESQDILVPWRKPMHISTSCEMTSATNSEDDGQHPYHAYTQTSDSDSNKSFRFRSTFRKKGRGNYHRRGRSIDPGRNSSPGSSSLSSPNETCYSFVRRAIQKLAGGSRRVVAHRPWFLESWIACSYKQPMQKRYDPDGCEYCDCCAYDNVEDQPIELLRIDDEEPKEISRRKTFPASQLIADIDAMKSKSMTNIRALHENNRTFFTNLYSSTFSRCKQASVEKTEPNLKKQNSKVSPEITPKNTLSKPKLVKQKKSVCDDEADEALDQPTDMKDLVKALPDFKTGLTRYDRCSVLKQRSLNEEILSIDRLREKERLKQHIQKQTSLNDELIYKRTHTFESLKDSIFGATTSRKFQMFKNGLTNRIRNTNMERVTGVSLKNGFVRIFQNWKGVDLISPTTQDNEVLDNLKKCQKGQPEENEHVTAERRQSKEDGSDSSKDSSLQSDTSVDSEDSFASVIFVPKSDPMSPIRGSVSAGPASPLFKGGCQSAPQSPRIKQSSCPTSPRVKQVPLGLHPLTKQLSSPKPSSELLTTASAFFPSDDKDKECEPVTTLLPIQPIKKEITQTLAQKYSVPQIPKFRRTSLNTPNLTESNTVPVPTAAIVNTTVIIPQTNVISPDKSPPDCSNLLNDNSRDEKLKKIREILSQKPGFGTKTMRSHCPIVRKISEADSKEEPLAKPIPKLLKLEIFNPEEDDDSDSSCVSSPDSVDSVVSIKSTGVQPSPPYTSVRNKFQFSAPNICTEGKSMSLLEAAANVASSLDEAVDKVIKSSTSSRKKLSTSDVFSILQKKFTSDTMPLLEDEGENGEIEDSRRSSNTWNEECHKHLTAFADRLSEKLMREIDEYQLTMDNIDDPYIHRLSEELHDLSKLSAEIKKQNEYLSRFSESTNHSQKTKSKACTKCKNTIYCQCKSSITRNKHNRTKREVLASLANSVSNGSSENSVSEVSNTSVNVPLNNYSKSLITHTSLSKSENTQNVNVNKNDSLCVLSNGCRRGENIVCGEADGDQSEKKKDGSAEEDIEQSEMARPLIMKGNSTDSCDSSDKVSGSSSNSIISSGATSINFGGPSMTSSVGDLSGDSKDCTSNGGSTASLVSLECRNKNRLENMDTLSPGNLKRRDPSGLSDISQDSLPSDEVGGEITYHRYYHVFREGELDQLIEKYVDNLHVVSSTYDHASWCIVAEKVQVWTI